MNNFSLRLKHLYLPCITITTLLTIGLLIIGYIMHIVGSNILFIFLASFYIIATMIITSDFLYKKFIILDEKERTSMSYFAGFIHLVPYVCVVVFWVKYYLPAASIKVTELKKIEEIKSATNSQYYTLKNFSADKRNIIQTYKVDYGRYRGRPVNYMLLSYTAMPLFNLTNDNSGDNCNTWYGEIKSLTYSFSDYELKKDSIISVIKNFLKESRQSLENTENSKHTYLVKVGSLDEEFGAAKDDFDTYDSLITNFKKYKTDKNIVLSPVFESLESRKANALLYIFISLAIGEIICLLLLTLVDINVNQQSKAKI